MAKDIEDEILLKRIKKLEKENNKFSAKLIDSETKKKAFEKAHAFMSNIRHEGERCKDNNK